MDQIRRVADKLKERKRREQEGEIGWGESGGGRRGTGVNALLYPLASSGLELLINVGIS